MMQLFVVKQVDTKVKKIFTKARGNVAGRDRTRTTSSLKVVARVAVVVAALVDYLADFLDIFESETMQPLIAKIRDVSRQVGFWFKK